MYAIGLNRNQGFNGFCMWVFGRLGCTIRVRRVLVAVLIVFSGPTFGAETCDLTTHVKLSLADFAAGPEDTSNFFFSDRSELTREGKLTIVGSTFEIEYEEFRDLYECSGDRNQPCVRVGGDERFIGEARIDKAIEVVVQLEKQISEDFNPFSRGGVADSGLKIWKILTCR